MQKVGLALVGLGVIVFLAIGLMPLSYRYEARSREPELITLRCGSALILDAYAVDQCEGPRSDRLQQSLVAGTAVSAAGLITFMASAIRKPS